MRKSPGMKIRPADMTHHSPYPVKISDNKKLVSIQYLRACAALAVIVYHNFQGRLYGVAHYGQYGVDLFFVISGFLMMYLTEKETVTPSRFAADRLARIVPTYWVATSAWFLLTVYDDTFVYNPDASLSHFVLSLLFIANPSESGRVYPTLYLGWILNYEMFFYTIFALILAISRTFRFEILAVVLVSLVVTGLTWSTNAGVSQFYTNPILLEFLSGAALGRFLGMDARSRPPAAQVLAVLLAAAGLLLFSAFDHRLRWGAGSTIVLAGALMLERSRAVVFLRPLFQIGNASYSIYLFQDFGIYIVRSIQSAFHALDDESSILHKTFPVLLCLSSLAGGLLAYRLVEKPATRGARRVLSRMIRDPVRIGR
ncbi:acyltransferase [Methylobacterium sp. CB376]|uniref:acyltransferase family protein n=1 Tax=unclassified Methylobacterium TaxID=2615210 RepID=UPI000152BF86|nr:MULTISPECIES: acyltransferase [Methylobacterium]WFT81520.1 acyltransferase [Methylobacterium nodulans]